MKKVRLEDLKFESWVSTYHVGAKYQGKPFTGIAEQISDNVYREYHYKNGRADGRWYEFNQKTGEVLYDGIFKNACQVGEHKMADEGFKIMIHCDKDGTSFMEKRWNPQGVLIKHYDKFKKIDEEYYNDGSLYLINKRKRDERTYRFYYLGKKSLWLVKEIGFDSKNFKLILQFNEILFKEKFHQLNSAFHLIIVEWYIKYLIDKDKRKAFSFIRKCLNHLDPLFRVIAVNKCFELGNPKIIPYLEKLNNKSELWHFGHFGNIGYGSLTSASRRAIRAIKKYSS